jgi:hypothetical protein
MRQKEVGSLLLTFLRQRRVISVSTVGDCQLGMAGIVVVMAEKSISILMLRAAGHLKVVAVQAIGVGNRRKNSVKQKFKIDLRAYDPDIVRLRRRRQFHLNQMSRKCLANQKLL